MLHSIITIFAQRKLWRTRLFLITCRRHRDSVDADPNLAVSCAVVMTRLTVALADVRKGDRIFARFNVEVRSSKT